uniref:Uncharacterized protein n=1 Tax=Anguilla anguilla TaxID=7936 RepID=A0A0E9SUH5_ANGAN
MVLILIFLICRLFSILECSTNGLLSLIYSIKSEKLILYYGLLAVLFLHCHSEAEILKTGLEFLNFIVGL